MKRLCIIPARGGSKRIPRKNVKLFAGRPMIAHSVLAAQAAGLFDRIVVSTDCDEIAAVAREYGAEVPFLRPAALADDFSGTDAVLGHALQWFADKGEQPETFCCIYATAPFVRPEFIQNGYKLLTEREATTAFSVTSYASTIFRALTLDPQGRLQMIWPENFQKRSQDFAAAYHDAGQFYWADTKKYLRERRLFSGNSVPVLIPRRFVQDIDTLEDWEHAEHMFRALEISSSTVLPPLKCHG